MPGAAVSITSGVATTGASAHAGATAGSGLLPVAYSASSSEDTGAVTGVRWRAGPDLGQRVVGRRRGDESRGLELRRHRRWRRVHPSQRVQHGQHHRSTCPEPTVRRTAPASCRCGRRATAGQHGGAVVIEAGGARS